MSRAAKITFVTTCTAAVAIVFGVHKMQNDEREALHQGPIRDMERQKLKKERTEAQKKRAVEYELQKSLREEYAKVQKVSDGPPKTQDLGKE